MTTGRVTNSDIDRRVGHLEEAVEDHGVQLHEARNQLNLLGLRQEHAERLFSSKFEQVLSSMATLNEQQQRVIDRLDRENRGFVELEASPVGRTVKGELEDLKQGRQNNAERIKRVEDRVLQAAAVLAVIGALAPWLVPLIVGAFGLPQ